MLRRELNLRGSERNPKGRCDPSGPRCSLGGKGTLSQDQPLGEGHLLGNFVRVTGSFGNHQTRGKAEGWVTKEATAVTGPAVGMPRLQHQGQRRKSPGFGDARGPRAIQEEGDATSQVTAVGEGEVGCSP